MTQPPDQPRPNTPAALQEVLGYLNFSSGASDPKFLASWNEIFRQVLAAPGDSLPLEVLPAWLSEVLDALQSEETVFADVDQARAVIDLSLLKLPAAYREHHRDLLMHQSPRDLQQSFLLGRMIEAVLSQGPPWNETERILSGALSQLNDYIGYRPVAVVESQQKIEPYEHEWVRPIPLYIAGAGVAVGPYETLIEKTLAILQAIDPELLAQAWFDPALLDELALDPRAYDFDHPVNKRPNYHFGQWDPHQIDNRGKYRRFIVQQVTLDALLCRLETRGDVPEDELLEEAATVLAGTMLMASGTSGDGPDAHDSNTTLGNLLPHVANYRDEFYERRLIMLDGSRAKRLTREAKKLRQPFGGARQHLNQQLASRRARQIQQVRLAQLYARMGYPEAAIEKAKSVRMASARMMSDMYCRLTLGHRAIDTHALDRAAEYLDQITDTLQRAIHCGAVVDPWNIVGFGGNFSLFPALENSIHDYRVDALIELMEQIFSFAGRGWSEAAARDQTELEAWFTERFEQLAAWWDGYATGTVSGVRRLVGKERAISTNFVAGALCAWHKAGAAAGDVRFWNMFVDQFDSPRAFQIVVEALFEKQDLVASLALLIQWLSQSQRIDLEDGDSSFHRSALRWIYLVDKLGRDEPESSDAPQPTPAADDNWPLVRRCFDYLEANAEVYWSVPRLDLDGTRRSGEADNPLHGDSLIDEDDDETLYSAAYEEMTYRDSTDDGVEGETLDSQSPTGPSDTELEHEAERLESRLAFLSTLGQLWKFAATHWGAGDEVAPERHGFFSAWQKQAARNYSELLDLLQSIHAYRLPAPSGDHESLVQYDHHRSVKESLLESVGATCVEMANANRYLLAAARCTPADDATPTNDVALLQAILAVDVDAARQAWPDFLATLEGKPILYVPATRGGDPAAMVQARATQHMLADLLAALPRLGMIEETCELLHKAQQMESDHPVGSGAVTEFDRLFETGYRRIVECVIDSSSEWGEDRESDTLLVDCLQQLTESQLRSWLGHSRTLRLSVVERLADETQWQEFVAFVERFGHDLFTQRFLHRSNLRSILHQGVDCWLTHLEEDDDPESEFSLLDEIGDAEVRQRAVKYLRIAFESVVENYGEYRDYNSTVTQSDRGELLYMFIDFLRVRADYDRVAWNLRPVNLVHETIVRRGRSEAAEMWRRALAERTSEAADLHQIRLQQLSEQYGMRLPTIAERIGERFVQPLAIDRVRALVEPAMKEASAEGGSTTFSLLTQEIDEMTRQPTGVGYDLPFWLEGLETEVAAIRHRERHGATPEDMEPRLPQLRLTLDELMAQLHAVADKLE